MVTVRSPMALTMEASPGHPCACGLDPERRVELSARRLAWMLKNAERLAPRDVYAACVRVAAGIPSSRVSRCNLGA